MTWLDDQTVYQMVWPDDSEHAGLVVAVQVTSMAADVAVNRFGRRLDEGRVTVKDVARLAAVFVEHVESWSVTTLTSDRRPGKPLPITLAAFLGLHRQVVMELLRQWAQLVRASRVPQASAEVEPEPVAELSFEDMVASTTLTEPDPGTETLVESAA